MAVNIIDPSLSREKAKICENAHDTAALWCMAALARWTPMVAPRHPIAKRRWLYTSHIKVVSSTGFLEPLLARGG